MMIDLSYAGGSGDLGVRDEELLGNEMWYALTEHLCACAQVLRKSFYRILTTARAPLLDAFFNGNLEAVRLLPSLHACHIIVGYGTM